MGKTVVSQVITITRMMKDWKSYLAVVVWKRSMTMTSAWVEEEEEGHRTPESM
jgi:hypothetical protein